MRISPKDAPRVGAPRAWDSVAVRLGGLLFASVLLISGITVTIEQTIHEKRVQSDLQERFRLVSNQTFEMMLLAMRQEAPASVDEILHLAAENAQIDNVRILDAGGKISHSSRPDEIGSQVPLEDVSGLRGKEVRVVRREDAGRPVADLLTPIANAPRCRACHPVGAINGIMSVRLDASAAEAELSRNRWILFGLVGSGMILVFLLLLWLARRMVLDPLAKLGTSMHAVAEGDLDTQLYLEAPVELRSLADAFNTMTRDLKAARNQLEVHHQDDLVRADRLATIGELASTMAHEIQNPLAGLSGALQVFAADPAFAHRKEILEELEATVRRLSTTVQDLLRFGRQSQPVLERTNLNALCQMVALFLEQQVAPRGKITVRTELSEAIGEVHLDPQHFRQVLLNLGLNAVQAMQDEGGVLRISTRLLVPGRDDAPRVIVEVEDTGPGIAPERLEQVFRPFYTTKTRGTGLGLPIVRRIVEKLCGRLELDSTPGEGTRVRIELPIDGCPEPPDAAEATS